MRARVSNVSARHEKADYPQRLRYMYRNAGVACLATTATTAASFFANLASVLLPLREFGTFMGLCIGTAYCLLLCCLPAILILNERCACCRRWCSCYKLGASSLRSILRGTWLGRPLEAMKGCLVKDDRPAGIRDVSVKLLDDVLRPARWPCCLFFCVAPIGLLVWTAAVARVDTALPEVFPEGFNQRDVKAVSQNFRVYQNEWWRLKAKVCNAPERSRFCTLNWCQTDSAEYHGRVFGNGTASCVCRRADQGSASSCRGKSGQLRDEVTAKVTFLGLQGPLPSWYFETQEWQDFTKSLVSKANSVELTDLVSTSGLMVELPPMVQEHWESGETLVTSAQEAPYARLRVRLAPESEQVCDPSEECYCGTLACSPQQYGVPATTLRVPGPFEMAQPGVRRLQEVAPPGAPRPDRDPLAMALQRPHPALGASLSARDGRSLQDAGIDVSIVWGLLVKAEWPLLGKPPADSYLFDQEFRLTSPSAQRHLLAACQEVSDKEEFLLGYDTCWIRDFRAWLLIEGDIFPVRQQKFPELLARFAATHVMDDGTSAEDKMWFDSERNLKATFFQFQVAMSYTSTPAAVILKYMETWDELIRQLNYVGPRDSGQAFHTSRLWIRAEAEQAIVKSTMATLMVRPLLASRGVLKCAVIADVDVTPDLAAAAFFVSASDDSLSIAFNLSRAQFSKDQSV